MKAHKEHRIACSPARFFELMFDPDFSQRLNREGMAVDAYEILERDVSGPTWRLRARVTPKDNMPGFLKKLIGASFSYEEVLTHQAGSDRASATMIPSAMRDKTRLSYEVRVTPDGDACKRAMDWEVEIKVFGLGGQIEKFALSEIERGMEASARYYNSHCQKPEQK